MKRRAALEAFAPRARMLRKGRAVRRAEGCPCRPCHCVSVLRGRTDMWQPADGCTSRGHRWHTDRYVHMSMRHRVHILPALIAASILSLALPLLAAQPQSAPLTAV